MQDAGTGSLFGSGQEDRPRILCRAQDIAAAGATPSYNGKWWEWQANRSIAGLLLPRKLVTTAIAGMLDNAKLIPSLPHQRRREAELHTAETFDVNPAVARIRLEEMFPPTSQMSL
jgi:hypothetical protein